MWVWILIRLDRATTMTQSYNLEQTVIIKSGFVLNCMISDKSPFCQACYTGWLSFAPPVVGANWHLPPSLTGVSPVRCNRKGGGALLSLEFWTASLNLSRKWLPMTGQFWPLQNVLVTCSEWGNWTVVRCLWKERQGSAHITGLGKFTSC